MREVLDCGVLLAPGHEAAMRDWVTRYQRGLPRVRLHLVPLEAQLVTGGAVTGSTATGNASPGHAITGHAAADHADAPEATRLPAGHPQDVEALARVAVSLRRYDSCLLPVAPSSVAWARMALSHAGDALTTPLLLLMDGMKAPAIEDLLGLGATDFMAQPACVESMRVRLARLRRSGSGAHPAWRQTRVEEAPARYAAHGASPVPPPHAARPPVAADILEQGLANLRDTRRQAAQESFRQAKARVVDGFEREYIRHALSRHGGNVAQAARACEKHRRAFWALMRKHGIEAAPYRQAAQGRRMRD